MSPGRRAADGRPATWRSGRWRGALRRLSDTSHLEAFSDADYAIVITLLVADLGSLTSRRASSARVWCNSGPADVVYLMSLL